MPKNRKTIAALAFVGFGIFLVLTSYRVLVPQHRLRIENISNGQTIFETQTTPGDNLWIVFINSVELLPVAEHYVVDEEHSLVFTENIYQAPYAGYLHSEKEKLVAPGTILIPGIDRPMKEVTFYAGYDSKHMLFYNGNRLPLYQAARGGDIIRITIEKVSRWPLS